MLNATPHHYPLSSVKMSGGGIDMRALQNAGFSTGDRSGGGGGQDAEAAAEKRQAMEDGRAAMLKSIMTADAKERLSRVALVRPDNARAVEEHLIRLARGGKLQSQVDEDTVKRLLEDVGKMVEGKSVVKKVTITRKKRMDDDDDDLEGL